MRAPALLLLCALALPACSADPVPEPAPAAAAGPVAAAPTVADPGNGPPEFRLPVVGGAGEMALSDAVAAAGGKPLVLVLGAFDCPYSTQEVDELAAARPGYAVLAVVQGSPAEVKASLPAEVPFPILADDGSTLTKYAVAATPSVMVLDGKGAVAYRGEGGYIPPALVAEMAAKVARGVPVGKVATAGG